MPAISAWSQARTSRPLVDDRTQGGYSYAYKVRGIQNDVEGDVSACVDVVSPDDCTLQPEFDTELDRSGREQHDLQRRPDLGRGEAELPDRVRRDLYGGCAIPTRTSAIRKRSASNLATPGYTDLGVTDGTPYYYQVTATDSLGNEAQPSRILNVTPAGADGPDPATFFDDVDTHTYLDMETPWQITNTEAADGVFSYHNAGDNQNYAICTCASITMPQLTLPGGATLTFQAMYDLEFEWDGVVQEISTDGGANWTDLPPNGGYPS